MRRSGSGEMGMV